MVLAIDFFIDVILIFLLPTNYDLGRWKQHLFDILSFTPLQKMYLKNIVELTFNLTFDHKFSCSTGYKFNLLYNKNSHNCILIT